MKPAEALKMLESAQVGDDPSRINPNLSKTQAVKIVKDAIDSINAKRPDADIDPIFEKRVYQVLTNRKRVANRS